jgi:putative PIN family toxin of toxin-antitoxin system
VKVVPDSNILISALIWGGMPARLVESAILGEVELCVSQPIIDETIRVLRRKGLDESALSEALDYIISGATVVTPFEILDVVKDDPDDNRIIECAIAAGADAIVTGDKHLLRLGQYGGIRIVRVRELLERRYKMGR